MPKSKVRYIERFPKQREIVFNDSMDFWKFYDAYLTELSNNKIDYKLWDKEYFKINKDGKPRKYNPAKHLQTKKSRTKALLNFRKYQKNKLKEIKKVRELIKQREEEIKKLLVSKGYNLDFIKIKVKTKKWKKKNRN